MCDRYRIVTMEGCEEFVAYHPTQFEARGYKMTGVERRASLRPELRWQPKLEGFCGPMWDGDAVRYESTAFYNAMT